MGSTPFGSQFLYLDDFDGDEQIINGPFMIGQVYQLTVEAADLEGGTVPGIELTVSGGATASATFRLPSLGPWAPYALSFSPTTTGPITIGIGEVGGYPLGVDDVTLTVPESKTWITMGIGAGLLGLFAHGHRGSTKRVLRSRA